MEKKLAAQFRHVVTTIIYAFLDITFLRFKATQRRLCDGLSNFANTTNETHIQRFVSVNALKASMNTNGCKFNYGGFQWHTCAFIPILPETVHRAGRQLSASVIISHKSVSKIVGLYNKPETLLSIVSVGERN